MARRSFHIKLDNNNVISVTGGRTPAERDNVRKFTQRFVNKALADSANATRSNPSHERPGERQPK